MTSGRDTYCCDCGCYLPHITPADHDAVCQACQLSQELAANRILDRAAEKLRPTLDDDNRAKLDRMRPELRREVARRALECGALIWRIS